MAEFFKTHQYTFDGSQYNFEAYVNGQMGDGAMKSMPIPHDHLVEFEYSNALNSLCLVGEIVFEDHDGSFSWMQNATYVNVVVMFNYFDEQKDGDISIDKYDPSKNFTHTFMVQSIDPSIEQAVMTYKLQLLSDKWIDLMKDIDFSNCGDPNKQDIFDIAKTLLVGSVGEDRVDPSFGDIRAGVSLEYAACAGDTFFSAFSYLYRRMFYGNTKTDSIKGLFYNEFSNTYSTFDLNDFGLSCGIYQDMIETSKSNLGERVQGGVQINIGAVTSFPRTSEYNLDFTRKAFDFSFDQNDFVVADIQYKEIVNAQNNMLGANLQHGTSRYEDLRDDHNDHELLYNNDMNIMKDMFDKMMQKNALIVNVKGNLGRTVNDLEVVSTDSSVMLAASSNRDDIAKEKGKYVGISGTWIIGKVVSIIDFKANLFRQNLVLLKTSIPDTPK